MPIVAQVSDVGPWPLVFKLISFFYENLYLDIT